MHLAQDLEDDHYWQLLFNFGIMSLRSSKKTDFRYYPQIVQPDNHTFFPLSHCCQLIWSKRIQSHSFSNSLREKLMKHFLTDFIYLVKKFSGRIGLYMLGRVTSWAFDPYSHTGSCAWKDSKLDLMLCCCPLEILNNFWTMGPTFSFCTGPWNYVAGPCPRTGILKGPEGWNSSEKIDQDTCLAHGNDWGLRACGRESRLFWKSRCLAFIFLLDKIIIIF